MKLRSSRTLTFYDPKCISYTLRISRIELHLSSLIIAADVWKAISLAWATLVCVPADLIVPVVPLLAPIRWLFCRPQSLTANNEHLSQLTVRDSAIPKRGYMWSAVMIWKFASSLPSSFFKQICSVQGKPRLMSTAVVARADFSNKAFFGDSKAL